MKHSVILRCTALLFIFYSFSSICISAQNYSISGYITDKSSGETLISATVMDTKSNTGIVSNKYGFYSISLPKGAVSLQYSYMGYQMEAIQLKLTKDTTLNIQLEPNTTLQEITVVGHHSDIGVRGSQMSAIEVPIEQIKNIPSLFGEADVIKALQLLPGVQAGSEGSAGMYVRGGGPDENLIIFDGVPVYNINHMMGMFSVFNADAVKDVTLYKGSFPARFGERLSSVVDISMKDGNNQKLHGNVSVGLISSKINLEGPIHNKKTTFSISFRRTYADILARPFIKIFNHAQNEENYNAGYYFYDFNAKVTHQFNDRNKIFVSLYSGDDGIYFGRTDSFNKQSNTYKLNWKWGNFITAMRWNHVINGKLFMNITEAYTRYRFNMKIGEEESNTNPGQTYHYNWEIGYMSSIYDLSTRADFFYTPNTKHDVKFGTAYTYHTFRPGVYALKASSNDNDNEYTYKNDTAFGDTNIYSHEFTAYVEDNFSPIEALKINAGVHFSSYFVQDKAYFSVEPRMSARVLITDRFSLKAGFAKMSQYIHLLSNNSISLPTDLWVPVTKNILPMKSYQYSFGAFYELPDIAQLSIETYYKTMYNLIEYKDGASFLGSSTGWENKVVMGDGKSYGMEFLAQRSFGNTTGWIGYTLAKSTRLFNREGQELNNGREFPAKYDRRHTIKFTVSHKFNKKIDASASWVYMTGNTATLALQYYQSYQNSSSWYYNSQIPYISERNNYRYNPYHRLDLSINFHKQKKHGIRTWNISVYNAYNHNNPFIVLPNDDSKQLIQYSIFPIIPSISYSFKF